MAREVFQSIGGWLNKLVEHESKHLINPNLNDHQEEYLLLYSASGKFFSEDSYSVRIQPKTVLIISLIFIGLVVLLHIYSKIGVPTKAVDTPIPKPPHQQQPQTTDDL